MAKIKGRFYFRLTENGNLIGEFSNDGSPGPQTESADRFCTHSDQESNRDTAKFEGSYHATWHEPQANNAVFSILKISLKMPDRSIYTVEWFDASSPPVLLFKGEAMIGEGFLIGNYWQI